MEPHSLDEITASHSRRQGINALTISVIVAAAALSIAELYPARLVPGSVFIVVLIGGFAILSAVVITVGVVLARRRAESISRRRAEADPPSLWTGTARTYAELLQAFRGRRMAREEAYLEELLDRLREEFRRAREAERRRPE